MSLNSYWRNREAKRPRVTFTIKSIAIGVDPAVDEGTIVFVTPKGNVTVPRGGTVIIRIDNGKIEVL